MIYKKETMEKDFNVEIEKGERFKFGANWRSFLETLNEDRIKEAEDSISTMLNQNDFSGLKVLDIGSGSGLFSLSFRRMGAIVTSFDYDADSVYCTKSLKQRYFDNDSNWDVLQGSVLDKTFLESLGQFDIVYSWGVLHHTGNMWKAIDMASQKVKSKGLLFIGIYEDLGIKSIMWTKIKKLYCSSFLGRSIVLSVFIPYYLIRGFFEDIFRLKSPFKRYDDYWKKRGMSKYHDWIDWLGGFPYEYSTIETLTTFLATRGFVVINKNSETMLEIVLKAS